MQMEKKNLNLKLVLKIFSLIQRNTMLVARTLFMTGFLLRFVF